MLLTELLRRRPDSSPRRPEIPAVGQELLPESLTERFLPRAPVLSDELMEDFTDALSHVRKRIAATEQPDYTPLEYIAGVFQLSEFRYFALLLSLAAAL